MKIAIFLPSLRGGGAERSMLTIANALAAKKEYSIDLILINKEGPYCDQISPNIRVINFQKNRVLKSLFLLRSYLVNERPCILVSALRHLNIFTAFVFKTVNINTKLILSERNSLIYSRSLTDMIMKRLSRWAYHTADAITSVSCDVSGQLSSKLDIPQSKIRTIYNPVVTEELKELAKLEPNHPWMKKKSSKVILSAGRLTKQKDYTTLIKAFHIVQKSVDCKLIIIGEGEERFQLEKLIQDLQLADKVSLPGFTDNPFSFMNQSDLFVLSSLWEGLPGVLIQAMACGTSVISTDCPGGSNEILENGKWGGLVPVGDYYKLAEEIKLFFNNDKIKANVKTRSHSFTVDESLRLYENLFDTIQT